MSAKKAIELKLKVLAIALFILSLLALLPATALAATSNQATSISLATPYFSANTVYMDINYLSSREIPINNLQSGDKVQVTSSNKSVVEADEELDDDSLCLIANKKGSAVITVKVLRSVYSEASGSYSEAVIATLTLNVKVSAMKITVSKTIKNGPTVLYKGESAQIKITNKDPGMSVSFNSNDKGIATVTDKGKVRARGLGEANISVVLDGEDTPLCINVGPKKGVKAVRWAAKYAMKSKYSQAKRMKKGYFDCSSLVGRAYGPQGYLLGGTKAWSSTAADQAKWCMQKKHVLFMGASNVDYGQLCPGDLIFYRLDYAGVNPGYKHIDHVAMYAGSGVVFEAGLGIIDLGYYAPNERITMVCRPTQYATPVVMAAGLKAKKASANSVKLSWSKKSGVTGYKIYRTDKSYGFMSYGEFKLVATVKGSSKKTYLDKNLTPGKTYYYRIRAYKRSKGKIFLGKLQSYKTGYPITKSAKL